MINGIKVCIIPIKEIVYPTNENHLLPLCRLHVTNLLVWVPAFFKVSSEFCRKIYVGFEKKQRGGIEVMM